MAPLPVDSVNLRGIGLQLALEWQEVPALAPPYLRAFSHYPARNAVTLRYPADHPPTASDLAEALIPFLEERAAETLPTMLNELADAHSIPRPTGFRFGLRKSIWASRSPDGTINGNVHLLFLPRSLLAHVLLHELCHTFYMDHGAGFHAALEKADPLAKTHASALRHAELCYIPYWMRG